MLQHEERDGLWWMRPWSGLTHCHHCNALHQVSEACPICGHQLDLSPQTHVIDGVEHVIPAATQGAVPWSAFVIIRQMQIEWERPLGPDPGGRHPAPRLALVILFWMHFEILMTRFYDAAFADLPGELGDELLRRFPSIGGRLERLYKLTWGVTFWDEITAAGYGDVVDVLKTTQQRRNAFVHGDPEAIDDDLVDRVVESLARVQEAWIKVFNLRCTRRSRNVPLWEADPRNLRGAANPPSA